MGAVCIHGVLDVFSEFQFRSRVSIVGAGRFSQCAAGVGVRVGRRVLVWECFFRFSSVRYRILGFRASVGGVSGFPPRAESVGAWLVGCFSSGNVSFDFP